MQCALFNSQTPSVEFHGAKKKADGTNAEWCWNIGIAWAKGLVGGSILDLLARNGLESLCSHNTPVCLKRIISQTDTGNRHVTAAKITNHWTRRAGTWKGATSHTGR